MALIFRPFGENDRYSLSCETFFLGIRNNDIENRVRRVFIAEESRSSKHVEQNAHVRSVETSTPNREAPLITNEERIPTPL